MLDWFADNLALIMFITMFVVIFCGYPVAFVMGGTALVFGAIGWCARCVPVFQTVEHPAAHVGWGRRRSGSGLDPHVHFHGNNSRAIRLRQGHAAGDRNSVEAGAGRACRRRDGDGHDSRRPDRRGRSCGRAALVHCSAADARVRLRQAPRGRDYRLGRNARHSHPARHHAGGDGRDAQHIVWRAFCRCDIAGLSALRPLPRLHFRRRDHQA